MRRTRSTLVVPAALLLGVTGGLVGPRALAAQDGAGGGGGLATVTPEQPLTIDALVTTVNGEPIYVKDVIRPLDGEFRRMAEQATSLNQFQTRAFARLETQFRWTVGEILMYSAAKEALGEEDMRKVDMIMNAEEKNLLARFKGSRALADDDLRARGSSVDKELSGARRQLCVRLYAERQLFPKINVRRYDIVEEYRKNIKEYTIEPQVDLYTITIQVDRFLTRPADRGGDVVRIVNPTVEQIKKAESDAMALGRKIYDELKAADNQVGKFSELAEKYSNDPKSQDGGRWKFIKKGILVREDLEAKAFALPPNTLAEPFFSPAKDPAKAWVVVMRVGDVVQGRVRPFSEVQDEIAKRLKKKQFDDLQNEYYKKLYAEAAIDHKDDPEYILRMAVQVVTARYAVKDPNADKGDGAAGAQGER